MTCLIEGLLDVTGRVICEGSLASDGLIVGWLVVGLDDGPEDGADDGCLDGLGLGPTEGVSVGSVVRTEGVSVG